MQEREVQKEIERRKIEYQKQIDVHFDNLAREKVKEEEAKHNQNIDEEKQKKLKLNKILMSQHNEMKEKYVKLMQQDKIEGELMKKKAREEAEKAKFTSKILDLFGLIFI